MISFPVTLHDHLGGFDKNWENPILRDLDNYARDKKIIGDVIIDVAIGNDLLQHYPHLNYKFVLSKYVWESMLGYNIHPAIKYKNFICSFNGSDHVGRQLLSARLKNQGYFNPDYCSKNFTYNNDWVLGHLNNLDLTETEIKLYSKFFITPNDFCNTIYSFGHVQYDHKNNIYNLENKLTQSFLHIVSETIPTSYYPFVTEKFLYSIVTRGLFLAYAQPGWHKFMTEYFGFKLYTNIFDYSFDDIDNPVKRLIKLIEMVSKFSNLSVDDWVDLYLLEADTIEYNYDHYFSNNFKKSLAKKLKFL